MKQNYLLPFLPPFAFLSAVLISFLPFNAFSTVILQYHHVSSTTAPITSISTEMFKQHMQHLKDQQFTVIALPLLIEKIRQKQPLEDKTAVITFDDGYSNVYDNARPILKQFDWPYTVFINPQFVDGGYKKHMNWTQLRQIASEKATIANHTMNHDYLVRTPDGLSQTQWLLKIKQDITLAEQRISKEIGQQHKMVAYPYGEFNLTIQKMLRDNGFVGIGQHSGAAGAHTDLTRVPRFPASGFYANLKTLKTKIASLPMPITALTNADPVFGQNPPTLSITAKTADFSPRNLQCFFSGSNRATVKWTADDTFTVTATDQLPQGRSRYNCTAPSKSKAGRFYWFSQPWVNADK